MKIGKIYLAHPLTTYGEIAENRKNEEKVFDKLSEIYPKQDIIRPLKIIDPNMDEKTAMEICYSLLQGYDALALPHGWKHSTGCRAEYDWALANKRIIIFLNF